MTEIQANLVFTDALQADELVAVSLNHNSERAAQDAKLKLLVGQVGK